jgi:cystathionine beta-lyase
MTWNFDEPVAREGTYCVKYDLRDEVFGRNDVIPMWVADMDFKTPGFIIEALRQRLDHEICGYTFRSPEYFSSIVSWLKKRHGWNVEKEWICFNPGIVPALNFCTLAFSGPGDEIIVQPPVYFPFFSAVNAHNRKLVHNQLREENGSWKMDPESLVSLINGRTRMIIISNPHNPVGRCWSREELEKLATICIEKNIIVISDEIHSDLCLPGFRHTPFASVSEEAAALTVTLIAPSKTFNLAGLATSSVIISNPELRKKFTAVTESLHVTNGNIFGNIASTAAYTHGKEWLDALLEYLNGNMDVVIDYCNKFIPEIKPVRPEATYMIWLDCRELGLGGKELQDFFVKKAGVGMNEGSVFGPGGEGFMRMNAGTTRNNVMKALEQIGKAVSDLRKQSI